MTIIPCKKNTRKGNKRGDKKCYLEDYEGAKEETVTCGWEWERNRKRHLGEVPLTWICKLTQGQLVTLELRRRKHFRRKERWKGRKHRNISGTCSGDCTYATLAGGEQDIKAELIASREAAENFRGVNAQNLKQDYLILALTPSWVIVDKSETLKINIFV